MGVGGVGVETARGLQLLASDWTGASVRRVCLLRAGAVKLDRLCRLFVASPKRANLYGLFLLPLANRVGRYHEYYL